jgi:hypothetical protein
LEEGDIDVNKIYNPNRALTELKRRFFIAENNFYKKYQLNKVIFNTQATVSAKAAISA